LIDVENVRSVLVGPDRRADVGAGTDVGAAAEMGLPRSGALGLKRASVREAPPGPVRVAAYVGNVVARVEATRSP